MLRWNRLLAPVAALWVLVVLQYLTGLTAVPFSYARRDHEIFRTGNFVVPGRTGL